MSRAPIPIRVRDPIALEMSSSTIIELDIKFTVVFSKYVETVLEKYGTGGDDQLIFLVPSTQQAPIFVEPINGVKFCDSSLGKIKI